MKFAVYPGSFDPITFGHIDILKRSQKLFDKIVILISKNMKKDMLFSLEERISMINDACLSCGLENVRVESTDKLTAEFAREADALCIIRGLRTLSDFDYEFQMALANKILNKDIETVFLMTDEKYTMVTSSLVKEIASYGGNLKYFVPDNVIKELNKKMNRRTM